MPSHLSICLCSVQSGFLDWYPFDPAKLDSPANQEKEVKNGRLAMVSYLSCSIIAAVQMLGSATYTGVPRSTLSVDEEHVLLCPVFPFTQGLLWGIGRL